VAWSVPVLAEGARGKENGFYPVAKINNPGSGSNKFCLAKLLHARTLGLIQVTP